ncbi:MAG: AgmX/PglI C-terminal domain-containing protein [Myxococcota bacterium]
MRAASLISALILSSCAGAGLHFRRSPEFASRQAEGVSRIQQSECRVEGEFTNAAWFPQPPQSPQPTTTRTSTVVPEVRGSLLKSEIAAVIQNFFPEFESCYEMALERNPELKGQLALHFTIGPNGQVSRTGVRRSEFEDLRFMQCMVEMSCAMRFPETKGGGNVIVTYPFIFSSGL